MTSRRRPAGLRPGRLELRRCKCGAEVLVGLDPLDDDLVLGVDHRFVSLVEEAQEVLGGRASFACWHDHAGHSWLERRGRNTIRRELLGQQQRPALVALDHICGG